MHNLISTSQLISPAVCEHIFFIDSIDTIHTALFVVSYTVDA